MRRLGRGLGFGKAREGRIWWRGSAWGQPVDHLRIVPTCLLTGQYRGKGLGCPIRHRHREDPLGVPTTPRARCRHRGRAHSHPLLETAAVVAAILVDGHATLLGCNGRRCRDRKLVLCLRIPIVKGGDSRVLSASRPRRVPYLHQSARRRPVPGWQAPRISGRPQAAGAGASGRLIARVAIPRGRGWIPVRPGSFRQRGNAAAAQPNVQVRYGGATRYQAARRRARRDQRRRRRLLLRGLRDPRRRRRHEHLHGRGHRRVRPLTGGRPRMGCGARSPAGQMARPRQASRLLSRSAGSGSRWPRRSSSRSQSGDHHRGDGRQTAARQPARQPATIRGEHVGRRGRGSVDCTGTPGSGHLHHVAAGIRAHDHGAGRCSHDDRAGGGRPQQHGCQRHGPDHDRLEHAGPDHPAALT
jgi:hypothetical protein